MKVNYQGNRDAKIVLLQIIGEHELPFIEEELSHIKAITQSTDFLFITVQVDSWNDDLSPWMAEPIFGDAAFAGNAGSTAGSRLFHEKYAGEDAGGQVSHWKRPAYHYSSGLVCYFTE